MKPGVYVPGVTSEARISMTVAESTALSFGQLSVLRDFRRDYVGREWQANLTLAWEVPGETTVHAVHEALVTLIRRHEILRTTYRDLDAAQPVQVVHAEWAVPRGVDT
jgi:hypothetical protein